MRITKTLLAMLVFSLYIPFASANLSISPLKHEFSINPGETKSELIKVTNNGTGPITLYTSKEDFIAGDDTGTPTFIKNKDRSNDEFSLSNWIRLENDTITLAKGETREIRFNISVPDAGEPGGHYGAIFFSPGAPSGAQVAVVQRLGVLVLVNVSGDIKVEGDLEGFEIRTKDKGKFTQSTSFGSFPITFETLFKNLGNVHIKPTGKIVLIDENGEQLKNIGKESIISPSGAYVGEKLVDYLPVNDSFGNVLPKSTRKFETIWQGFGYQELNDDGTKAVKFKNLSDYYKDKKAENKSYLKFWESIKTRTVNKKITAALELSYEGKDKEKKDFKQSKTIEVAFEEQYVGISYLMISSIIVILGFAGYYMIVMVPKSREKLKARLMAEIKEGK